MKQKVGWVLGGLYCFYFLEICVETKWKKELPNEMKLLCLKICFEVTCITFR